MRGRPRPPVVLLLAALAGHGAGAAAGQRIDATLELPAGVHEVRRGETLSGLVAQWLPAADAATRRRLMEAILYLNPDAFVDGDPNRLRAGARLILPGDVETFATAPRRGGRVETYRWGAIRRPGP